MCILFDIEFMDSNSTASAKSIGISRVSDNTGTLLPKSLPKLSGDRLDLAKISGFGFDF